MNNYYRVIWNEAAGAWQAVCEICRSKGKSKSVSAAVMAISSLLVGGQAMAADLPTGGQLVGGTGTITQTSSTMTINQTSAKMAIDWQSFSVGQGKAVNFVQPGTSSVALNRVLGSDVSVIQGAINANGQVFLLNPNGVLFTPTAQVNVGALVASTLKMSTDDFMAGTYKFTGDSANAVINQGNITAVGDGSKGGTIALIAAKITNDGNLTANGGQVLLGAGSEAFLDMGGPVKLQVTQGAIDALVQNGGAIKADGGLVYLTAQAVDTLTTATINNTGVIRAQTLATGEKGEIRLMGDMKVGTVNVGGTLDASAPNGGDGGFIETSAATVNLADSVMVTTIAPRGKVGSLLIDPNDYIIAATGGNITGATLAGLLNTTDVTINTAVEGTSGHGDIFVNDVITKSGAVSTTLKLLADRNITVNQEISSNNAPLNIILSSANALNATVGGIKVLANLISSGGDITIGGGVALNVTSSGASDTNTKTGNTLNESGFALNYFDGTTYGPGVYIAPGVNILSQGANPGTSTDGAIIIKGATNQKLTSGYDAAGESSGVTIGDGGSIILSGGNSLTITGVSTGYTQEFGLNFVGASGQTTFGAGYYSNGQFSPPTDASSSAKINLNGWNTAIDITSQRTNDKGSMHLQQYGQVKLLTTQGLYVSDLGIKVNGTQQNIIVHPDACTGNLPACGYLEVPAGNQSYPDISYTFKALTPPNGIVVNIGDGSKFYDGKLNATGLSPYFVANPIVSLTDVFNLGVDYSKFLTSSPIVGRYTSLAYNGSLPTTYNPGSGNYTIVYQYGNYDIIKAPLGIAVTGIYNGTTSFNSLNSTIVTNGVIAGETVTGVTVNDANVDLVNGNTNYVKTATGTGGFDIGNYQLYTASSLVARNVSFAGGVITNTNNTASITAEPVPVLQPPPAAPVIVPAFPDNGVKAIANEVNPPEFGGMNYVPAKLELAADPQAPVNNQLASTEPATTNAMSYVGISSKVTGEGEELQVRLPEEKGRKPQSEFNVNNTAVATNTSPLDVFVVDTGVNLSGLNKMGNVK